MFLFSSLRLRGNSALAPRLKTPDPAPLWSGGGVSRLMDVCIVLAPAAASLPEQGFQGGWIGSCSGPYILRERAIVMVRTVLVAQHAYAASHPFRSPVQAKLGKVGWSWSVSPVPVLRLTDTEEPSRYLVQKASIWDSPAYSPRLTSFSTGSLHPQSASGCNPREGRAITFTGDTSCYSTLVHLVSGPQSESKIRSRRRARATNACVRTCSARPVVPQELCLRSAAPGASSEASSPEARDSAVSVLLIRSLVRWLVLYCFKGFTNWRLTAVAHCASAH